MSWYAILLVSGGVLLFLCGGGWLLIRVFLIVITVQGKSMSPTLEPGDRVLAIRPLLAYRVQKGHIVLFRQTLLDEVSDTLSFHIKRVAALAGEKYVSSVLPPGYNEYVIQENQDYIWQVPPNHIFVCGDNREQSIDSRSWGPLPLRNVRGIVVKKLAPSPALISAHVAITQRRTENEQPDRFHVESH